jgi:hypothetical protein
MRLPPPRPASHPAVARWSGSFLLIAGAAVAPAASAPPLKAQAPALTDSARPVVRRDSNVASRGGDVTRWRVTATAFRNPGTGVELRRGALLLFAGHYPTVFRRDGGDRTTHFARAGVGLIGRAEERTAPYASLSWAVSASRGWPSSAIAEGGVRQRLGGRGVARRLTARLGAALLVAPRAGAASRGGGVAVRLNPTVGLGFDL